MTKETSDPPPSAPHASDLADYASAEDAFTATATLRATYLDATLPRIDLLRASAVGTAVAAELREPARAERMAYLSDYLLPYATRELLGVSASALWAAAVTRAAAEQSGSKRRVDPALSNEATELRTRMLRVAAYTLADLPEAEKELASIRSGSGYMDLATDLDRLATLYRKHPRALADGGSRYRPQDAGRANTLTEALVRQLGSRDENDIAAARREAARAFRLFEATYYDVRKWALAMFDDTENWFPNLYAWRDRPRTRRR